MDTTEILALACSMVPNDVATEDGLTTADVREELAQNEWELALDLLEELGDVCPLPAAFWDTLAKSAEQMMLDRSAAWCRWRSAETRSGIIRAEVTLLPAAVGRRRSPIPGTGVLRPMWNIGLTMPDGRPDLKIAVMWVEYAPELPPGGQAAVRLLPLDPPAWWQLNPGDTITMHEAMPIAGTATVLEIRRPGEDAPLPRPAIRRG